LARPSSIGDTNPVPRKPVKRPATLSAAEARRLVLRAQGLDRPAPFVADTPIEATFRAIERLGYVQIDTISVVERAHHHVLWSRVPEYQPALLDALHSPAAPRIFEYWSHAASYLPLSSYRFCLPRMHAYASGRRGWFGRPDKKARALVMDRIRAEGPLQARDFDAPKKHKGGSWFEWKPAKAALEQLFTEGALMVRERRGFQKVFDLTERVLPSWVETTLPTPDEHARHLIGETLRASGLATAAEFHYLRREPGKTVVERALAALEEAGAVVRLRVQGAKEECYALPETLTGLAESGPQPGPEHVRILSPFDHLVIQRKRLQRLFGFDYQIECYVPEPKRKHGYFVLPVLWGDRLAARVDCKAERGRGVLVVKSLHVERPNERKALLAALGPALEGFAAFNGCGAVER
jgi:hypothetical protein